MKNVIFRGRNFSATSGKGLWYRGYGSNGRVSITISKPTSSTVVPYMDCWWSVTQRGFSTIFFRLVVVGNRPRTIGRSHDLCDHGLNLLWARTCSVTFYCSVAAPITEVWGVGSERECTNYVLRQVIGNMHKPIETIDTISGPQTFWMTCLRIYACYVRDKSC